MNTQRLVGIALAVIGVILFIIGLNASDSVADRMSNFFTGRFTDATVWYMVGGAALVIIGGLMALFSGRRLLA